MNRFQLVGIVMLVAGLLYSDPYVVASGHTYAVNTEMCKDTQNQSCPQCDNGTVDTAFTYTNATPTRIASDGIDTAEVTNLTKCSDTQECVWEVLPDQKCTYNFFTSKWGCNSRSGEECKRLVGLGTKNPLSVISYSGITGSGEG
jgi:hypothetical protein